jgi:DNA invertase Pin-like site-specific DNA recombinase
MSSTDLLRASHPQRSFVVAYVRVSTEKQGKSGLGLAAQKTAITEFCAREGFAVGWSFSDVESGGNDDRAGLADAIKQSQESGCPIVVAKLDRLGRKVSTLAKLMEECDIIVAELGIQVSPLMLHIYSAVAEAEKRAIGERTKAALAAKKAQGWVVDTKHLEAARETSRQTRKVKAQRAALAVTMEYFGLLMDHAEEREKTAKKLKMCMSEYSGLMGWFHKRGTFQKGPQLAKLQSKTSRGNSYTRLTLRQAHGRAVGAAEELMPEDNRNQLISDFLFGREDEHLNETFRRLEADGSLMAQLKVAWTQLTIASKKVKAL